jgi:nitrous oxidase accessory protein NosD
VGDAGFGVVGGLRSFLTEMLGMKNWIEGIIFCLVLTGFLAYKEFDVYVFNKHLQSDPVFVEATVTSYQIHTNTASGVRYKVQYVVFTGNDRLLNGEATLSGEYGAAVVKHRKVTVVYNKSNPHLHVLKINYALIKSIDPLKKC